MANFNTPPPPGGFGAPPPPGGFGTDAPTLSGPPAEFGPRLLAYLIDTAIGIALSIPPFILLVLALVIGGAFGVILGLLSGLLFIVGFLGYLYVLIMGMAVSGQTPGKRVQGVKVTQDSGAPLGVGGAIIRWLLSGLLNSIIGIPIASLWMLWDSQKKTAYDKILSYSATTVAKGKLTPMFPGGKPF